MIFVLEKIKQHKEEVKRNKERFEELKKENKNLLNNIARAREEIAWLRTETSMNRYGCSDLILKITNRKLDDIEDILGKDI